MPKPTQKELKEFLSYDPLTGELHWIKKAGNSTIIGSRAGGLTNRGYRRLMFKGKQYQEHHIVWCWVHGSFPPNQIDHDDQVRYNNRISNLKSVTKGQNARNRARRENHLSEAGIWYCKRRKRYIAEITFEGEKIYQKSFEDIKDAIQERAVESKRLGFNDNHGKSNNSNRKFYD